LEVLLSWLHAQFVVSEKADAFFFCIFCMQEKYEEAMTALSQMEKRAVMAETMLEATKQYQAGQFKANQSFTSRYVLVVGLNFHDQKSIVPHWS
jgi:histidyl-tRNA synthetase